MSRNLDVGIRITADGRVLITEVKAAQAALNQIGETAKRVNSDSAAAAERFTANLKRQADTLGMTASQVRAYDAAQLKLNDAQRASVEASNRAISAFEKQQAAAKSNIDVLGGLKANLVAAAAAYVSFSAVMGGGKAVIETALANERLSNTLKVATGTAEAAARETAFLRQESDKLGLSYTTVAAQYAKLAAASKGTVLEGQATRDIFLGIAKASTVLGLSVDQTGGALLAIEQMISKGNVSAEELRGQLGERLPGAFQVAARAMGVTTQELDKMLVNGQITAAQLLPLLAKELEKTFGAQSQEAAQGLQAKINRLDNAFTDLKTSIGNTGLLDFLSEGIVLATRLTDALSGGKVLSAVDQQTQKIAEMRAKLERMKGFNGILPFDNIIYNKKDFDLLEQQIEDGVADLKKLEKAAQDASEAGKKIVMPGAKPALPDALVKEQEKAAKAAESAANRAAEARAREAKQAIDNSTRIIASLKLETEQIGLNNAQKRMMLAATEAAKAPTKELAEEIMASAQAWALATQRQEDLAAAEKQRVDALRAIEEAEKEAARASEATARQSAAEWNQLWSGVEQTAKTAFIQFAAHGTSAMESIGESIKVAIIDMLYQLTIRKWIINIGTSMEGGIANSIMSGMSGGALSAFVGGASGDPLGGLISGGYTGNAARAASIGSYLGQNTNFMYGGAALAASSAVGTSNITTGVASALATFGGPYGLVAAAVVIALDLLNKKFGNHEISKSFQPVAKATQVIANPFYGAEYGINQFEKMLGTNVVSKALPGYFVEEILGLKSPDTLIANALFGRGQFKLQNQQFQANVGADGIQSAALIESYKAKGSVFRGSRTDNIIIDAITGDLLNKFGDVVESGISSRLQFIADARVEAAFGFTEIINDALSGIGDSMRGVAKNLSIGTQGLDTFSTKLTIMSEKGKVISQEDFTEEIARITDEMVVALFPAIAEFAKRGERASETFARLNDEFLGLVNAGTLLGSSFANAKQFISNTSFEGRTEFIENAGGLDALQQKAQFFSQNFLTAAERLAPVQEQLNEQLTNLGLSTELTREQFKGLVQSFGSVGGITEEMLQSLLNLQGAFVDVRNAQDQLAGRTRVSAEQIANERLSLEVQLLQVQGNVTELRRRELETLDPSNRALQERIWMLQDEAQAAEALRVAAGSAFSDLQKSVDAERTRLTDDYNAELDKVSTHIQDVADSINKLKSLSDALKTTVNQIRPLNRVQAKQQIQDAIDTARSGGELPDADSLRNALSVLGNSQSITGVSSSFEFAKEQAKTANLIAELGGLADSQLTLDERSLKALETRRDNLGAGFKEQIKRLDKLVEQGQKGVDMLSGLNNAIMSLTNAIGLMNNRILQGGGSKSDLITDPTTGETPVSGNPKISDKEIRDFVRTPGRTDMEIYNAAKANGVSFVQYAAATGTKLEDLEVWAKKHNLKTFASGGFHRGGLRIVGEHGPELEFTGPSRIASNNDLINMLNNNDALEYRIASLEKHLKKIGRYTGSTAKRMRAVTRNGNALRTTGEAA